MTKAWKNSNVTSLANRNIYPTFSFAITCHMVRKNSPRLLRKPLFSYDDKMSKIRVENIAIDIAQ